MDRGKQKSGSRYFLDRGLIQRVSELVSAGVIHPDNICEQLRQKYPAVYGRKPYAALKVSIDKALHELEREKGTTEGEPPRQKRSKQDDEQDEESDSSSLEMDMSAGSMLVDVPNTNSLNNSLRAAYKKTSNPPSPGGPVVAPVKKPSSSKKSSATKKRSRTEARDEIDGEITAKLEENNKRKLRPSIRYKDLGGMEDVLQEIRELIERPILHPELFQWLGVEPPRGILLHGPPGCGKTHLAMAIAGELDVPFFQISAPEIVSGLSGESEARLRQLFQEAAAEAPSLIFMDEIDAITPKRENAGREMERRIVAQLLTCMDDLSFEKTGGRPVLVIGATNRPDSLDPALRRAGRFDREIALGVPDESARARILTVLSSRLRLEEGNFDFHKIAQDTPGYVGADLVALTKEAASIAVNRIFSELESIAPLDKPSLNEEAMEEDEPMDTETSPTAGILTDTTIYTTRYKDQLKAKELQKRSNVSEMLRSNVAALTEEQMAPLSITMADFFEALKRVQPSSKREGFATIPNTTWDDIGALGEIRRELQMALLEPIRNKFKYEALGIHSPQGILLYGPPGCGKTLLAKAVANEAQASFINVKGPELLNKFVGESERAVRVVFQRARASAPCIIFFDELDALAPKRSGSENAVGERVVNQLLIELDGMETRRDVFVIAATNRPDMIDAAMLRPGRLDKLLYVPLPDPSARLGILQTCGRKTPFGPDVDLIKISSDPRCDGYSGADLAQLVREASMEALQDSLENNTSGIPVVSANHFHRALNKVVPSVSKADEARYNALRKKLFSPRLRVDAVDESLGNKLANNS